MCHFLTGVQHWPLSPRSVTCSTLTQRAQLLPYRNHHRPRHLPVLCDSKGNKGAAESITFLPQPLSHSTTTHLHQPFGLPHISLKGKSLQQAARESLRKHNTLFCLLSHLTSKSTPAFARLSSQRATPCTRNEGVQETSRPQRCSGRKVGTRAPAQTSAAHLGNKPQNSYVSRL